MPKLAADSIIEPTNGALSIPLYVLPSFIREEELEEEIVQANRLLSTDPRETFSRAQIILKKAAAYPALYARALRTRAMSYGAQGKIEDAASDFQTSAQLARERGDLLLESQCLHGLANIHHYRGEFALALETIQQANALRRAIGDDAGLMCGLNSEGAFLGEMGDLSSAVACFFDSLRIAQRVGSSVNESLALTNIGHLKLENGEPERAISYLEQSLAITDTIGARVYQPFALEIMASALQKLQRLDEAFQAAQRGIQVCREVGNPHHEVTALYTLARIQIDMGQCSEAEAVLLQALEMATTLQSGRSIADIHGDLGRLYTKTGDFAKAEAFLCRGLRYACQYQQQQQICEMHLAFSELYEVSGDLTRALASLREYHEVYKTLQKESLQNRLGAQVAQMAVQRAQQEAEIHRLRTVELAALNQENERLLERIKQQAKSLAQLAITDPLTGLYNRRYLKEFLGNEMPEEISNPTLFSLALLDLDDFKQINDRFSHSVGDEVLKTTAQLLRQSVRDHDIVVRFGGEEFIVVLPKLRRADALTVCERIRSVIAAYNWSRIHPDLQVTTSIGLVDSREEAIQLMETESSSESLLLLADKRLYQAKATGKNRVL